MDPASREILAAPFYEESFSHEPDEASAWMKAITTLVIRNSHLEEMHAYNGPVTSGITSITRYGLGPLSHLIAARRRSPLAAGVGDNPFVELRETYPRAWACLEALRTCLNCGGGRMGYRSPGGPVPELPDVSEVIVADPANNTEMPPDGFTEIILAGSIPGSINTGSTC
jgi:hypothetical protein